MANSPLCAVFKENIGRLCLYTFQSNEALKILYWYDYHAISQTKLLCTGIKQ